MNSRIRRRLRPLPVFLLLALLGACSPERDPSTLFAPDAVGVLVVDAVLMVDQPLPTLWLTRTLPPDVPYSRSVAGVTLASVTVGWGGTVRSYTPFHPLPGLYLPRLEGQETEAPLVEPLTRYDLRITTEQGEELTATTLTPDRFRIDRWVLLTADGATEVRQLLTFAEIGSGVFTHPDNRLQYAEGLLDAYYAGADAAVYGAAGFQLSLFSLDPDAGLVIDPPFLDEEDLADLPRQGSSPVINGEDGFVRLPWFSIFYDGPHLYKAYAVDRNWFDLERTIPEGGFGFGGNLGDGIDPPLFHVTGGIGLFGSASADSVGFSIEPLEQAAGSELLPKN